MKKLNIAMETEEFLERTVKIIRKMGCLFQCQRATFALLEVKMVEGLQRNYKFKLKQFLAAFVWVQKWKERGNRIALPM